MLKVAHLSSVHRAFDTRIFHRQCRTLAAKGNDVVLIVPHDHEQVVDGVRIDSLPLPRDRFDRMTRVMWTLFRRALQHRADVYHLHDPELIIVGCLLKLCGRKVVYDVHEDVPGQIMSKKWLPKPMRSSVAVGVRLAEYVAGKVFDGIICTSESIASRFPSAKTALVRNFPMEDELATESGLPLSERSNRVVYVGALTPIRAIRELVSAVAALPDELGARLVLVGEFISSEFRDEVSALPGWDKVEWLGWKSREEVAKVLSTCRVGAVLFYPEPNHYDVRSNKLYEYMSAGLPVVGPNLPEWVKIIDETKCGVVADPLNVEAISAAIEFVLSSPDDAERMAVNGKRHVNSRFNWNNEAESMLRLYQRVIRR